MLKWLANPWVWLIVFLMACVAMNAYAQTPVHNENPEGACDLIYNHIPGGDPTYRGLSADERDYIFRWDDAEGHALLEVHYGLAPRAQWKGDTPVPLSAVPLSYYFRTSDVGGFDYWVLDPRWRGDCKDMLLMEREKITLKYEDGTSEEVDRWILVPHDPSHRKEKA